MDIITGIAVTVFAVAMFLNVGNYMVNGLAPRGFLAVGVTAAAAVVVALVPTPAVGITLAVVGVASYYPNVRYIKRVRERMQREYEQSLAEAA